MYQCCIFDLDGTLANTLQSIAYFGNKALKVCGYRTIEADNYRYLAGDGADTLMRRMLQTVAPNYTEKDVQTLRKTYDGFYESDSMHLVTGFDGIPQLLIDLKNKGIKIAVLSNKPHNVTSMVVEKLFPKGTFDVVYGQRDHVERKPSPQGALLIAEELDIVPQNCLYIGDTNVDMQTGTAAKMDTVGVLWGFRDREELKKNHASYIAVQPNEILQIIEN